MRCLLLSLLLLSSSAWAEAPKERRVLVLDFVARAVPDEVASTLAAGVAVRVGRNPELRAVSGAELRRMVDFEAERANAGCADDTGCLAELAGALGAELVVFGEVGRVGELYVVTLGMFDPSRAEVLARETVREASVDALPAALDARVDRMMVKAGVAARAPEASRGTWLPWAAVAASAAVTALGATGVIVGLTPTLRYLDAAPRVEGAQTQADATEALAEVRRAQFDHQTWGLPVIVVGGVAVVAGVAAASLGVGWALAGSTGE